MSNAFTPPGPFGCCIGRFIAGIFPIGLLVLGLFVLSWNEGRAVRTTQSIVEGRTAVTTVSGGAVFPFNQGKLICTSGEMTTGEVLSDYWFGISANAIRLYRQVLMYQWQEILDHGFRYNKVWYEGLIPSYDFQWRKGHENPQAPICSGYTTASSVTLGGFQLSDDLIEQMNDYQLIPVDTNTLSQVTPDIKDHLTICGNEFYYGSDWSNPQVGDLQIRFSAIMPQMVSVIAMQDGNRLVPYATRAGAPLDIIEPGNLPPSQLFDMADHENNATTWGYRSAGFMSIFFGIVLLLLQPVWWVRFIPVLGGSIAYGLVLAALTVSAVVSLITISLAWIFYRPGVGLLLLGAAAIVFILVGSFASGQKARLHS